MSENSELLFHYAGQIAIRPVGRGVVLEDLEGGPQLDDVLSDGDYWMRVEILSAAPQREVRDESFADAEGALARLVAAMPTGSFIQIGKRGDGTTALLTIRRHIPGLGSVEALPLELRTTKGAAVDTGTALELLALRLEAAAGPGDSDVR